jgi:hypothetical protein
MTTTTAWRRFTLHYLEMVVAMLVGMFALGPVWRLVVGSDLLQRTDVMAMSMATNMVVAMSLWMWLRGHSAAPIAEMALAMYLPFVVLLVPLWLGLISAMMLMVAGHVLMFALMLVVMLRRRDEYTCHHHNRWSRRQRAETATEARTAG